MRGLWPYIWPTDRRDLQLRVMVAMLLLLVAKLATIAVPFTFKWATDALVGEGSAPVASSSWLVWVFAAPIAMTVAYGGTRILMAVLTQTRDGVFAKVAMHAVRRLAYRTFEHMHQLSLRFHLERKTGGLTRVLERGRNAIETIVRMVIMQLVPTIIELGLIVVVLLYQFDWRYVAVVLVMVACYMVFTYQATEWRINIRRRMNDSDTDANVKAIDSLLNYETVKYFVAEEREARALRPVDGALRGGERPGLRFARRAQRRPGGDLHHRARDGDGAVRHEHQGRHQDDRRLRHDQRHDDPALPAAELHGHGLSRDQAGGDRHREDVRDPVARSGDQGQARRHRRSTSGPAAIRFENVTFAYDPERPILKGVSFEVPAGHTIAVVGPSGAGKSTISRLLFRFYDVTGGRILIDGQDIRDVTQNSLRMAIGMVPQDTVLFNDTIRYNIRYGRWEATDAEVEEAARLAQIDDFIRCSPEGLRDRGRRARAEALRRREAARGDRAHDPQGAADPDPRRGDLGARQPHREGHPGRARPGLAATAPRW